MAIFPVFDTASSALTTNRIWMDAISDNLANVNTIKPFDQPAFQARFIEAQELPSNPGDPVGVGGGVEAASIAVRRRDRDPALRARQPDGEQGRATSARPTSTSART